MFELAFMDSSDGQPVRVNSPDYNREYLWHPGKGLRFEARIGESFMDFLSLPFDIRSCNHPFWQLADNISEDTAEHSGFFTQLREYMDLIVEDPGYASVNCYISFLHLINMNIPAFHYQPIPKAEYRDKSVGVSVPYDKNTGKRECSLKSRLASVRDFYDVPLVVYKCETIEDACCASLHFLITRRYTIRRCRNCGKYFVAYNRSDSVYCDRVSPFNSNVTCRQDGAVRAHREAVRNDRLKKLVSNTQTMWRMRQKRFPEDEEIQQAAVRFKANLKKWQTDYKTGKISEDDFIRWLKHFNSKKSGRR